MSAFTLIFATGMVATCADLFRWPAWQCWLAIALVVLMHAIAFLRWLSQNVQWTLYWRKG